MVFRLNIEKIGELRGLLVNFIYRYVNVILSLTILEFVWVTRDTCKGVSSSCSSIRSMRLRERGRSRRTIELGRAERKRERKRKKETDRWVCCRTGYLTNVRPKPARVGYKRVFCNAPSSEFSPHKAPPVSPLPVLPFFFSFLPRVDAVLRRCPCTIESFRFYGAAIVSA